MENFAKKSLAHSYQTESKKINFILFSALILFLVGIFAPILTFEKFFIFSNKVSIISGLFQLLSEGHPILFGLIFIFSIALPFIKLFVLYMIWNRGIHNHHRHEKLLHLIAQYGKWSMLDVFVAAILVVTVKLKVFASVKVHFGLYAFAASVILTMLVTSKLTSLTNQSNRLQ